MDAVKKHRLFDDSDVLSITDCTDTQLKRADEMLGQIAGQVFDGIYEPGTYFRLVKAGKFTASLVQVDGKPKVVVIHTLNALGWLIVDGVAAIDRCPLDLIFDSVDTLARAYKSQAIIFVTKLKAVARMAKSRGYKPGGILFLKNALPA